MEKSCEEMTTFEKLQECYKCMMEGELNSSLRNYFWVLSSIVYNYDYKNKLMLTKEELAKVKFFNIKLMHVYELTEDYVEDIENFNDLERKIREQDNLGTTM